MQVSEPVTLEFILGTIGVIFIIIALGILAVKKSKGDKR